MTPEEIENTALIVLLKKDGEIRAALKKIFDLDPGPSTIIAVGAVYFSMIHSLEKDFALIIERAARITSDKLKAMEGVVA